MTEPHTEPLCPPWTTVVEALRARDLLEDVADVVRDHRVTMFEACSRMQTKKIAKARHAAWAYLREQGFSYPEIGRLWGVSHSTVHRALHRR
jgi:chromosomal replication initiation ATPase DnaA